MRRRKHKENKLNRKVPVVEYCDPQDEIIDIERNMFRIRYAVAIGRFKISKKHSIKEYTV